MDRRQPAPESGRVGVPLGRDGSGSVTMADERLKFRCYRCNQLISASRSRVGKVVDCPRCKARLEVPSPDPEPATATGGGGVELAAGRTAPERATASKAASPIEEIAASIPDDLIALRPEDIRVEAEFADLVITTEPEPLRPGNRPAPAVEPEVAVAPEPPAPQIQVPQISIPDPPAVPVIEAVLPGIQIEPASILPPGQEFKGVREVVLQPATVLAWSLLVLMSVPMAFVAGLLLGHFVWR